MKPLAAPSARTTSSKSAWPCTITRTPTDVLRRARKAAAGGRGACSSSLIIEQRPLYNAWNSYGSNVPSGGAADGYLRYARRSQHHSDLLIVAAYGCPSDPNAFAQHGGGVRYANYVVNYGNVDQAQNANYPVPNPQNPTIFFTFDGAPFTDIGSPAIDDTGYAVNFATLTVTRIAAITDGLEQYHDVARS